MSVTNNMEDAMQADFNGVAIVGMMQDVHSASKAFQAVLLDPAMSHLVRRYNMRYCSTLAFCLLVLE